MKSVFIVFSGYNQRAVVAFLRTLSACKVDFAVVAASKDDTILASAYGKKVCDVRTDPGLSRAGFMKSLKKAKKAVKADRYVIAPSTEALNRFLIANKSFLEKNGCEVPLVDRALYETISDKYLFGRVCEKNGIAVPKEYSGAGRTRLPCVAKPKKYFSGKGLVYEPVIIYTREEMEMFLKSHKERYFYFQEFVGGESIYLLYYFSRDGFLYKYSQENLAQQPGGKSIIAARSSDWHNKKESDSYERLFKKLGFYGLVMVEIRKQGKRSFMIEANPRFWGPSQLFVDAGANFFEAFLHDLGISTDKPVFGGKPGVKYFWFGGMVQTLRSGKNCVCHGSAEKWPADGLPAWMSKDVYNRRDTDGIFKKETESGAKKWA
jgi:predicted ATP-grasp superfamily ATP-dependent carboligase